MATCASRSDPENWPRSYSAGCPAPVPEARLYVRPEPTYYGAYVPPVLVKDEWTPLLETLTLHLDREYASGQSAGDLPDEVQALPFWRESITGSLASRLAIPFYQLYRPPKNSRCLYLGCGPSFLSDPWLEWEAYFYGQDLSDTIVRAVRARAPRLNSKLFKAIEQGPPHRLDHHPEAFFDLVIANGFSYYLPLKYSDIVLNAVRRVAKVGSQLLWEVVDPASGWYEDWSIIQMYRDLEVPLTPLDEWVALLSEYGTIQAKKSGELFCTYHIQLGHN